MENINNQDAKDLGLIIRGLRLQENMTQAALANKLGVTRLTVVDLEAGGNVGMHTVARALKVLGGEVVPIKQQTLQVTPRQRAVNKMINANLYSQLNLVTWDRKVKIIPEDEVFTIYERNRRFLDLGNLEQNELKLIKSLTKKYGNGVML